MARVYAGIFFVSSECERKYFARFFNPIPAFRIGALTSLARDKTTEGLVPVFLHALRFEQNEDVRSVLIKSVKYRGARFKKELNGNLVWFARRLKKDDSPAMRYEFLRAASSLHSKEVIRDHDLAAILNDQLEKEDHRDVKITMIDVAEKALVERARRLRKAIERKEIIPTFQSDSASFFVPLFVKYLSDPDDYVKQRALVSWNNARRRSLALNNRPVHNQFGYVFSRTPLYDDPKELKQKLVSLTK